MAQLALTLIIFFFFFFFVFHISFRWLVASTVVDGWARAITPPPSPNLAELSTRGEIKKKKERKEKIKEIRKISKKSKNCLY